MGSSSSPGARRQRVAIIADAIAESQERFESATASSLGDVRDALAGQGFEPVVIEFAGEPASWLRALREGEFDLVFNLCEGLSGQGSEEHLPAAAVELLGLPMTGARALTLGLCLRKDLVNAHLRAQGIAIPDWAVARAGAPLAWRRYPAIVKPVAEDASLGIDAASVVRDGGELEAARARGHESWERLLVQRFIGGREFNLAVVGDRVLPPAEIEWALPEGLPHVMTYAAKWDTGSVYDRGTVPRLLGAGEERLSARLARLAGRVWAAVDGVGYGRIDVRMDERGRVHVIDVNPNPDLSPSAGLARQAFAAGWSYPELIARIVDAAFTSQGPLARARGARRAEVSV
jgi:D-alanine-D-alanine ligase